MRTVLVAGACGLLLLVGSALVATATQADGGRRLGPAKLGAGHVGAQQAPARRPAALERGRRLGSGRAGKGSRSRGGGAAVGARKARGGGGSPRPSASRSGHSGRGRPSRAPKRAKSGRAQGRDRSRPRTGTPATTEDTRRTNPRPGAGTGRPGRGGGSTRNPGRGSGEGSPRSGGGAPGGGGGNAGQPSAGGPRSAVLLSAGPGSLPPTSSDGRLLGPAGLGALPGARGTSSAASGAGAPGAQSRARDQEGRDPRDAHSPSPLFDAPARGPLAPLAAAVPDGLQWLVTALGALAAMVLAAGLLTARRSSAAARRRRALLDDIGLLQSALLPPVPERVGGLRASVAYRPWAGPGAGGDFYDVFPLDGGRAGVVLGDVAGHGREVIGHTSALRHTLRAYLEAGLEPREALELAGRVLDINESAPFATAVLAVHDPEAGAVTWASGGHPPPVLLGERYEPLGGVNAPPLGAGVATGIRQTTMPLKPGVALCLFSDGLLEARVGDRRLERGGLEELASELGTSVTASALLERVAARATEIGDDMAVCVLRPAAAAPPSPEGRERGRIEELALPAAELSTSTVQRFLWACGIDPDKTIAAMSAASETVRAGASGVLLRVELQSSEPVEVRGLEGAALSPAR